MIMKAVATMGVTVNSVTTDVWSPGHIVAYDEHTSTLTTDSIGLSSPGGLLF